MFGWIVEWFQNRKARVETERRLKQVAIRSEIFGNMDPEKPSATGIFNAVKGGIDDATDKKRDARRAAERINESLKDSEPL
jgi:hypothetical protein